MNNKQSRHVLKLVSWIIVIFSLCNSHAVAGGKVSIYGIHMVPYGTDAQTYSRAGWGGGLDVVVPLRESHNIFAGTAGLEIVNLLSESETFQDRQTGLIVEQQTDQNYFRLYLGIRIGGHGNGFLRPHVGANIALVYYNMTTDVVVPDDYNRENEIRQNLHSEGKAVFGYDLSMGLDLNFSNALALDGGVKYLSSLSVPQQLGEGSVKIHPQYFQIFLEIGLSFDYIGSHFTKSDS
jgi:hypothetical protein